MLNKKRILNTMISTILASSFILAGCSSSASQKKDTKQEVTNKAQESAEKETEPQASDKTIKIAYYPNEGAAEFNQARGELRKAVSKATGREVEDFIATDYNIVIEAIANGQVDMALMGAVGYIEAKQKNDRVEAVLTNSGPSGTLEDALYFSFIAVREEDSNQYKDGDGYTIKPIQDKIMSFVSNNSTSGFKVPADRIVNEFGLDSPDDLIIEGDFFKKVLFGGSHQGSAVNLLKGDSDVSAFMNITAYFESVGGEENKTGMLYRVKEGAESPFDSLIGKEARIIASTPVLNGPFVVNRDNFTEEELKNIIAEITSDEIANNELVFAPKDSDKVGLYKKTGDNRMLQIDDSFYNPLR